MKLKARKADRGINYFDERRRLIAHWCGFGIIYGTPLPARLPKGRDRYQDAERFYNFKWRSDFEQYLSDRFEND